MNISKWKKVKMKELVNINPENISTNLPDDTMIEYIDLESVKSGKILGKKKFLVKDAPSRAKRVIHQNDILFSTVRPYQKNFAIITEKQENLIASTGFAVLRVKENNDFRYIYQLLYSDMFMKQIIREMKGSNYPAVNASDVENTFVISPTFKEQQKIADILSTVDTQIEQTEQMIEQTKELKQGLMQQLLTKGIGHTEFKNSAIGEIPLSWNLVKLGEIASRISVGYVGSINKYYTDEKGVILLRTGNIKSGNIDLNDIKYVTNEFHKKNNKSQLEPGDIIVSRHGDSGSVAVIPEELSNANCLNVVVVKKSELMNSTFIAYLFNSGFIKAILSKTKAGSVQGVINTKDIQEVTIPYPSLEEQQKISEILSSVDDQIDIYEKEKEKYEELKKGLMQQLLTGKIRVKVDE